MPINLLKIN